jgi:hypothetical protein
MLATLGRHAHDGAKLVAHAGAAETFFEVRAEERAVVSLQRTVEEIA